MMGDGSDFARYFTEDCRFVIVGNAAINAESGLRLGRDGVISAIDAFALSYTFSDALIEDILVEGDRGAVLWHATVRATPTGRVETFQVFDHLRFREGLIAELACHYDSASFAVLSGRI